MIRHTSSPLSLALVVGAISLGAASTRAEPDALAERLVSLRAEVEALSEELSLQNAELREKSAAAVERRAELDAELSRERLRIEQLERRRAELSLALKAKNAEGAAQKPAVLSALDALRVEIDRGLPFRRAERVAAVDELVSKVKADEVSGPDALVRTWSLVQDELKLSRENGLYRQTIRLEGEDLLVDVARIGMVLLYFKAEDGRVGYAERTDDGAWRYVVVDDPEGKKQVVALVDAFKKQIRTGYFALPGRLPLPRATTTVARGEDLR